jgi:hypothetical protein
MNVLESWMLAQLEEKRQDLPFGTWNLILNYCQVFRGLYFSVGKQQNKTAHV